MCIVTSPPPPLPCAHRTMYLLGYIPKDDRLYLGDKELNIVSYSLLVSVLEYQTAVMRRDFGMADKVLPTIPKEQRTRVAHFLEKQVGLPGGFFLRLCHWAPLCAVACASGKSFSRMGSSASGSRRPCEKGGYQ